MKSKRTTAHGGPFFPGVYDLCHMNLIIYTTIGRLLINYPIRKQEMCQKELFLVTYFSIFGNLFAHLGWGLQGFVGDTIKFLKLWR